MTDAVERARTVRAGALRQYAEETASCTKCALANGRTHVVFGSGNPDAELMFVGEAPGFHEDQQGLPFVGQAGKLLDRLLEGIGLTRGDVMVVNVLKCRPPGNRDPMPEEIAACEPHLFRQIELIEVTLGARRVLLYPLYHPAAALYTPSMLEVLESDFARIPDLLSRAVEDTAGAFPDGAFPAGASPAGAPADGLAALGAAEEIEAVQLGLF